MNYSNLLNELNQATLFDLYRLSVAIRGELNNRARISALKQNLRIGMQLGYFHAVENRVIPIRILELRNKQVLAVDLEGHRQWEIPYFALNLENADTTIHERSRSLNAQNLKVGDCVGFSKDGQDIVGIIKRRNSKTVTLVTSSGMQWRVAYSFLYRVYDGISEMERLARF